MKNVVRGGGGGREGAKYVERLPCAQHQNCTLAALEHQKSVDIFVMLFENANLELQARSDTI